MLESGSAGPGKAFITPPQAQHKGRESKTIGQVCEVGKCSPWSAVVGPSEASSSIYCVVLEVRSWDLSWKERPDTSITKKDITQEILTRGF